MKVVLYLRYSSEKQTEQSIEGQRRICTKYCEQNGMTVTNVYIDRATSASKNIDKRTSFLQMIRDSEKRSFEGVVVYKLDRFARSRYDSANYKYKLKKNGVRVISATENISENPEGIILESVLEGMAEFYSMELAQKVTRGMTETALKGNSCGGCVPLGYKIENKKFVIDPNTAPLVKEVFQRYANGETIISIVKDFKERGLKTPKGTDFNKNSFQNMLQNERYTGIYKYKDIRIENGMPAIIDKTLFENVQRIIESNKQTPRKSRAADVFLLSQKIFCGHCGALMHGDQGTSKTGRTYLYYSCSAKKSRKTCDKKSVPKDFIETQVVKDVIALLTPERIEELAEVAVKQSEFEFEQNQDVKLLSKQIEETDKSINNLLKLVERGSDSEALFNRLNELERQKKEYVEKLQNTSQELIILDKDQITFFLMKFTQGDPNDENYRRRVIDLLVNSVTVWDEPDGYFKITTAYNLTSMKSKTFKCSSKEGNAPPEKALV